MTANLRTAVSYRDRISSRISVSFITAETIIIVKDSTFTMSSVPVSLSNALFYVQTSGIPQELSDISVYDEVASKDISIYNFKTELNVS